MDTPYKLMHPSIKMTYFMEVASKERTYNHKYL